MKKCFGIGMSLVFLFQTCAGLGWMTWYRINKTWVATALCENRDQPQLQCDGKCYLRKQIGLEKPEPAESSNQPTLPESIRQMAEMLLFCENDNVWQLHRPAETDSQRLMFAEEALRMPQNSPASPERPPNA